MDRRMNKVDPKFGNSHPAVLLGIASLLIIILGPTASPVWRFSTSGFLIERIVGFVFAGIGSVFLWWAARKWPGKQLHSVQCLVLIPLGLIVFLLPARYTEASAAPFPHIYALIIVILLLLTILARGFSNYVLKTMLPEERSLGNSKESSIDEEQKNVVKGYARTLADLIRSPKLDLMVEVQEKPPYSRPNAWQTLFAPARKPLLLAFLPCLCAIMVPDVKVARVTAALVLIICWAIFSWGMYYSRWDLLISILTQAFMQGGPAIVSLLVIVLGVGHLLNVQYITTVLHGGPVFFFVLSAYFAFWLFEYWTNRFFFENLMMVFKTGPGYNHTDDKDKQWELMLDSKETERADKITILSGSRFLVQDSHREKPDQFRIYMPDRLLDRLALGIPNKEGKDARATITEVKKRMSSYFSLLNFSLILIAIIFVLYEVAWKDPEAIVTLEADQNSVINSKKNVENSNPLVRKLQEIAASDHKKAILVAASGGGSRAALYTTSVLCGLHGLGVGKNIALLSSVSGGSAATAYYAANFGQLNRHCDSSVLATAEPGPWPTFYRTMGENFIDDVLNGVVERRIVGPDQNGVLLAESFQRHFGRERRLDEVDELGLIFNTTLTGHPYHESRDLTDIFETKAGGRCVDNEYIVHAGSRLILTNLPPVGFPEKGPDYAKDSFLNYTVINTRFHAQIKGNTYNSLPLFAAAALSANFPPVFSDAGLLIKRNHKGQPCEDHYWVTDGGATDNRGILSLLYALREAVGNIKSAALLPELHILLADASAESIDYSQIRGIGGKLAASVPMASQLKFRLVRDINRRVCELRNEDCENDQSEYVHVHYLEMPVMFRTRGGLGTHWKLPRRVIFSDPSESDKDSADDRSKSVRMKQALAMMAKLHGKGECKDRIDKKFHDWICDVDSHQDVWEKFTKNISR